MRATPTILFFSRGRGHGHAVPDMALAAEIRRLAPGTGIRFASYATGAETLRRGGWDPIDLGLPERNEFIGTLRKAQRLIGEIAPSLVVAHEEFAALPAARICGVTAVFLSAWLPPPNGINAECLAEADEIVVLWEAGTFASPHPRAPRPRFVGPIGRKLSYGRGDRARARAELEVPAESTVVTVAPGGWAGEERAPIAAVVLDAFARLPGPKLLFWLAGADASRVRQAIGPDPAVRILGYSEPVERWLAASDILVTKGTRGLSLEAARLGLPSISLSPRLNPIDDLLVAQIRSNVPLVAGAVDGETLARCIGRQLSAGPVAGFDMKDGLEEAARVILGRLGKKAVREGAGAAAAASLVEP